MLRTAILSKEHLHWMANWEGGKFRFASKFSYTNFRYKLIKTTVNKTTGSLE